MGYLDKIKSKLPSKEKIESTIKNVSYNTGLALGKTAIAVGSGVKKTGQAALLARESLQKYQAQQREQALRANREELSLLRQRVRLEKEKASLARLKEKQEMNNSFGSFDVGWGSSNKKKKGDWNFGQMPRL